MKHTFKPDKTFCCPGFQHRIADAGQRGIAVLVINTSEGIQFWLQSRGIAFADEKKISPVPSAPDMQINVSCEIGLQFCPFCGRKLVELVSAAPEAYAALASKHSKFYSYSYAPSGTSVSQLQSLSRHVDICAFMMKGTQALYHRLKSILAGRL